MQLKKILMKLLVLVFLYVQDYECLAENQVTESSQNEPPDDIFLNGLKKGVVPKASTRTSLPEDIFRPIKVRFPSKDASRYVNSSSKCPNYCDLLSDPAQLLHGILRALGYNQQAWFISDYSFSEEKSANTAVAVLTELEQIDRNGQPLPNEKRWDPEFSSPEISSLTDFMKTLLIGAPPGRYRSFLFGFSRPDRPMVNTGASFYYERQKENKKLNGLQALVRQGNRVPVIESLKSIPFYHICYVFIYEFEISPVDGSISFVSNSSISAEQHLKGAGILDALGYKSKE